jgi:hypothetical protein
MTGKLFAIAVSLTGETFFSCMDDNENPALFTSLRAARVDLAHARIEKLKEFISSDIDWNEVDSLEMQEFPVEVEIRDGKIIAIDEDVEDHVIEGDPSGLTMIDENFF